MSIVSVKKRSNEGRGGSIKKNNVTTYRDLYVVVSDDPADTAKTARDAVPVAVGDSYPDDITALCTEKDAELVSSDTDRVWHVRVEYSSEKEGNQQSQNQFRPTEVRWGSNKFVRGLDFVGKFERTQLASGIGSGDMTATVLDGSIFPLTGAFKINIDFERIVVSSRSGNVLTFSQRGALGTVPYGHYAGSYVTQLVPPLNSANDKFDPPLTIEESSAVLTISRNETYYNPLLGFLYNDAINSDYWTLVLRGGTLVIGPLSAKCLSIEAESEQIGFATYARVSYHFEIKDTWLLTPMDAGFRELTFAEGIGERQTNIQDSQGQPISVPAPLDMAGHAIPIDTLSGALASDPQFHRFRGFKELPFNDLALP